MQPQRIQSFFFIIIIIFKRESRLGGWIIHDRLCPANHISTLQALLVTCQNWITPGTEAEGLKGWANKGCLDHKK